MIDATFAEQVGARYTNDRALRQMPTHCPSCGDPLPRYADGPCLACRETGETLYQKEIVYDRETNDYAMMPDGELVGFARTYTEAEVTLGQLVSELMSGRYFLGV